MNFLRENLLSMMILRVFMYQYRTLRFLFDYKLNIRTTSLYKVHKSLQSNQFIVFKNSAAFIGNTVNIYLDKHKNRL